MIKGASLLLLLLFGCSSTEKYSIVVEESGAKIITGTFDRDVLMNDVELNTWYTFRYNEYVVDSSQIPAIASLSKNVKYILIVGTWCGDSKREIPHLVKIFDAAKVAKNQFEIHGVDRTKKSDDGITVTYPITHVPTIIVLKGSRELGRIVEQPTETLERDLVKILQKQ